MGRRGRPSAAALALVATPQLATRRPEAPVDLTPEQAAEWDAIVGRCPADWFPRETYPLLAQYCRATVSVRKLSVFRDQLESAKEEFDLDQYERVAKLIGRETHLLTSLATKMRLSQHASYDAKKSKAPALPAPWEAE